MDELVVNQDTATFAKVEGFAVRLFSRQHLGHGLRFVDGNDSVLAEFSWWDDVDVTLRGWTLDDVPMGTAQEPFWESDQCWVLVIWRDGDDVLIAETDDPQDTVYERRSRVPAPDYFAAWEAALREARDL